MSKEKFLQTFLENGGEFLGTSSFEKECKKTDSLLLVGDFVENLYKLLKDKEYKKAFLFHPLFLNPYPKIEHCLYECECEEALLLLLAHFLVQDKNALDVDVGYLSSESNLAEEELETILKEFGTGENQYLVVGKDFYNAKDFVALARILAFISSNSKVKIVFLGMLEATNKPPLKKEKILCDIEVSSMDGLVVYLQENKELQNPLLEASGQFRLVSKMQEGSKYTIKLPKLDKTLEVEFKENPQIKGMVAILWLPKNSEKLCYCKIER
ncbi:hypothetical protein [Helicobacter burdigaliensis]|uniref:hypothetical protein n=1 Tax=Helicobacter burdigaliensis TaxID=2315334 RepID=UPI000EF6BF85|nr:hypothetical protein [Helicobacter burdigaliensis]